MRKVDPGLSRSDSLARQVSQPGPIHLIESLPPFRGGSLEIWQTPA